MTEDQIREAADKWVFEQNGHRWSNNNSEAGDNFGSFIAGAKWAIRVLSGMEVPPSPTEYGFEPADPSIGSPGGWAIEGGKEAYYDAIIRWGNDFHARILGISEPDVKTL